MLSLFEAFSSNKYKLFSKPIQFRASHFSSLTTTANTADQYISCCPVLLCYGSSSLPILLCSTLLWPSSTQVPSIFSFVLVLCPVYAILCILFCFISDVIISFRSMLHSSRLLRSTLSFLLHVLFYLMLFCFNVFYLVWSCTTLSGSARFHSPYAFLGFSSALHHCLSSEIYLSPCLPFFHVLSYIYLSAPFSSTCLHEQPSCLSDILSLRIMYIILCIYIYITWYLHT